MQLFEALIANYRNHCQLLLGEEIFHFCKMFSASQLNSNVGFDLNLIKGSVEG